MNLKPPLVKDKWEENNVMTQALLIAYSQLRDCEEADSSTNMLRALLGSRIK